MKFKPIPIESIYKSMKMELEVIYVACQKKGISINDPLVQEVVKDIVREDVLTVMALAGILIKEEDLC